LTFTKVANPRWYTTKRLYCVECPQYSIRLEAFDYLCRSCLLPAVKDV